MASILEKLRAAAHKRKAYNGIVAEIWTLTDRELDDIGVSRADARRIAREAIYG